MENHNNRLFSESSPLRLRVSEYKFSNWHRL